MASDGKPNEKPPADAEQWQLALFHLQRAHDAGGILRLVLFAAAAGFIVFVLAAIRPGEKIALLGHLAAVAFCVLALTQLVRSWQLQKEQSEERFKFLRSRDFDSYLQYDAALQAGKKRGELLDKRAFLLRLAALVLELAVRAFGVAHAVNV